MKRNAKLNSRKLSAMLCLALTLVLVMTALFAVTASAAEAKATLTFDSSKSNRTSFSTSKQVWEQNGIVFTNNKGSGSNVADYGAPVRLYKSSSISIEAPGNITQIVFKCVSGYVLSTTGATTSGTTVTVTLDGTSDTYTISSLSAQVRLNSLEVTYTETNCAHAKTTTTTNDATCTKNGSIVTTCDECGLKTAEEVITAPGHNYINGVCDVCDAEKPAGYELVSDVSTLKVGDKIVIVAVAADKALGSQNGNYRNEANVEKDNGIVTFEDNAGVEIITIEAGKTAGTFAFKVTEGYLSAVSSSSNNLSTEKTISDNSSWAITISDGVAEIVAQGAYTRNTLNYNLSSPRFSCYANTSTMKNKEVNIYKLPSAEPEAPECEHKAELRGAVVNLGQSLAIKYYVNVCEHDDIANYSMKFTMNENTVTVNDVATDNNGTYFAFTGIAPQCMGDNVAAELLCDGEAVLAKAEYSVLANLKALLADNAITEAVKTLIYNTLAYGAEAQKFLGYKTDALVNAGYEANATESAQPTDAHKLSALTNGATASFKSAAVEFGDVNKIIVKINATDVANVTLKVGETALTLTEVENGVYAATTDAISALNLDSVVGFNLYVGETLVQTLEYSVNDYASRKWTDAEMGALVKALYAYGVSAKACAN